jgi:uncharacterized protein (DUF2236 family)
MSALEQVRTRIATGLFERVAGDEGPNRRDRIATAPGPRWFAEDRPIRRVHGDSSMFVGGLRALLLQSLHPLAMAGVAGHSGYRGDPWGRLQRTSYFLGVTTFGCAADAQATIDRIKSVHERVNGIAPDGRPYAATDPHLLSWVHLAEIDSFLRAHQRYGAAPLDQAGRDGYVADTARIALALGVLDPPHTEADLAAQLAAFRPELEGTREARGGAGLVLFEPPYAALAGAAVGLLPIWARWPLRLPYLPLAESTVVRLGGQGIVRTIRWALAAPPSAGPAARADSASPAGSAG